MKNLVRFAWSFKFALVAFMMVTAGASSTSSATTTRDSAVRTETAVLPEEKKKVTPVVVRFYFIRHGQTQANIKKLVLGQTDSPLTESGQKQAQALGRSDIITKTAFWRKYASDLGRAQQTTRLILGKSFEDVQLERLLREFAKGAREGLPKSMTYEEAEAVFREDKGPSTPFPPLETQNEVLSRIYQWMYGVIRDAIQEYRTMKRSSDEDDEPKVYCIFAVSHSGALRATIGTLVRDELPTTIDFTPAGPNGAPKGGLQIPNTSVTIIDIIPDNINDEMWDPERESQAPIDPSFLWQAKLKTLTNTDHYQYA